jgi:threonine synthase
MQRPELPTRLVCSGCGASVPPEEPYPFRCPAAGPENGVDHVLVRRLWPTRAGLEGPSAETNPFVRYRERLHSYHRARAAGLLDGEFTDRVRRIDEAVAAVDGRHFRCTPFFPAAQLAERLGMTSGGLWVKDETGNVSGSHKARHLMGILLHLEASLPQDEPRDDRPLAIASCGNAALAAAVLARAVRRTLEVYIPPAADPQVVRRLEALGARLVRCPRLPHEQGDPCYLRFREATAAGALPFTCQGPDNGLTIEGGQTLGYEMISESLARGQILDRLFVQVGGGALASSCVHAFDEAVEAGLLPRLPRIHAVQTRGAYPLARAYEALRLHVEADRSTPLEEHLRYAARHRPLFMRPWEVEPQSIAHGILDDETYDWHAVVSGMLRSGGHPVVVDEPTLAEANQVAREATGIPVDPTGSAGLAGLAALLRAGRVRPEERVAVLFTGIDRAVEAQRPQL